MSFSAAELEALIPRLRRYAHALVRQPAAADDLVQDALERAWTHRYQWRPGSDLRAWAFSILHNVFLNQLRIDARLRMELDDPESHVVAVDSSQGVSLRLDLRMDLEKALGRMAADQRAVLLLVGVEELSYHEAAKVLGVPVGTVMSRLARGRERLRQLMDGQVEADRPNLRVVH